MSGGRGATSSPWRNIQTEGFVRGGASGVRSRLGPPKSQNSLRAEPQFSLRGVDLQYPVPYTPGYMVKQHKHGEPNSKSRKVINMAIGSIATVPEMIDDARYCPEIIQQIKNEYAQCLEAWSYEL